MNKNKLASLAIVSMLGVVIMTTFYYVYNIEIESLLAEHYVNLGVEETGAINLVTAVLFDYRAFDTLGEATVIFTAASAVAMLIPKRHIAMLKTEFTSIVHRTIALVIPFFFMISLHLIFNGHLSPGGGFTGGVVVSAAVICIVFTYGFLYMERRVTIEGLSLVEDWGAIALLSLGVAGIAVSSHFFSSAQAGFYLGNPGELLSAGIMPLANMAVGAKVGAGLSIIFIALAKEE